jgi:hypothetical protein
MFIKGVPALDKKRVQCDNTFNYKVLLIYENGDFSYGYQDNWAGQTGHVRPHVVFIVAVGEDYVVR